MQKDWYSTCRICRLHTAAAWMQHVLSLEVFELHLYDACISDRRVV